MGDYCKVSEGRGGLAIAALLQAKELQEVDISLLGNQLAESDALAIEEVLQDREFTKFALDVRDNPMNWTGSMALDASAESLEARGCRNVNILFDRKSPRGVSDEWRFLAGFGI